ncbi:Carboxylesterase, partial [Syncephalis plumigaleata]
ILTKSTDEPDLSSPTLVATEYGMLRGLATDDRMLKRAAKRLLGLGRKSVEEENKLPRKFLGIPFAAPPIGDNRFKKPQPLEGWGGIDASSGKPFGPIRDAVKSTDACVQLMPVLMQGEDCLHLDIYTPSVNRLRELNNRIPVMVWIFPGGFFFSNKNMFDMYDGAYLAETKNKIIVSINHRLGPFGFLNAEGADKNVGLFDQRAALEWISKNIEKFGGDPNNITLMGESSGAYSILAHMVSPTTPPNLFHRAIVMSSPTSVKLRKEDQLAASTLALAERIKCTGPNNTVDIACLRNKSWPSILTGHGNMLVTGESNVLELTDQFKWWATLDNDFFVEEVYDSFINGVSLSASIDWDDAGFFSDFYGNRVTGRFTGLFKDFTPTGFADRLRRAFKDKLSEVTKYYPLPTTEEATVAQFSDLITDMLFRCPIKSIADAIVRHNSTVYTYELAQNPPRPYKLTGYCRTHTCHTSDLFYLWARGDTTYDKIVLNAEQRRLADQIQNYWSNFATNGNPNRVALSYETSMNIESTKILSSSPVSPLPSWPVHSINEVYKCQMLNDKVEFMNNARSHYCKLWDTIGYNY